MICDKYRKHLEAVVEFGRIEVRKNDDEDTGMDEETGSKLPAIYCDAGEE